MQTPLSSTCCVGEEVSRRAFLRSAAAAAIAAPLIPSAMAAPTPKDAPETLVTQLYKSLKDKQREAVCFEFDHALRSKVDANWHITEPQIDKLLDKDQQDLVKQIFMGLHSEEYAETVYGQVMHDSGKKGFGSSSIALFGEPGTGKFEFVLTGRHCTRRCDGDSVKGAAFGGPIFYGHAADSFNEQADHKNNAYWYQGIRANKVFQALDGKQQKLALLDKARRESGTSTVKLTGKKSGLPGIPLSELSKDQKQLVNKTLADLLAPFRKADSDEVMKLVKKNGMDNLHMAFFKQGDIGNDRVWDVWQIEGPAMVWYFRGAPHVHTWAHIRDSA